MNGNICGHDGDHGACGSGKIEVRMRDIFPGLGTVTWSELVWGHEVPASLLELVPPGLPVHAGPGRTLRMTENICFGVPLVCGDVVETRPAAPWRPGGADAGDADCPQVTRAVVLQEGLLVIADGYAEISRRDSPGGIRASGPGVSDLTCDCGHCTGPGLDARWWDRCEDALVTQGAALAETDGDRIVAFFPAQGRERDLAWERDRVVKICCSAGMVRDTLQVLDRTSREVFLGLRLVGGEDADGGGTGDGADRGVAA